MKFIYQVKYTGPTKKDITVKEFIVVAHNDEHATKMCERVGDLRWWNTLKLGVVTADVNHAVDCGVLTTVTV